MPLQIKLPSFVMQADPKDKKAALRQLGKEAVAIARDLIMNSEGGPGNAPKNRTGKLASKLTIKVKTNSVTITDNDAAALALETGGKASKKRGGKSKTGVDVTNWILEPHPFMTPTLEKISENASERLGEAIEKGISLKPTR